MRGVRVIPRLDAGSLRILRERLFRASAIRPRRGVALNGSGPVPPATRGSDDVSFLREHIRKEDDCLADVTASTLSSDARARLTTQFDELERQEVGERAFERYATLADKLEALCAPIAKASSTGDAGEAGSPPAGRRRPPRSTKTAVARQDTDEQEDGVRGGASPLERVEGAGRQVGETARVPVAVAEDVPDLQHARGKQIDGHHQVEADVHPPEATRIQRSARAPEVSSASERRHSRLLQDRRCACRRRHQRWLAVQTGMKFASLIP
jgi:hypothetical protein